jgi:transcriptional regulator with XRE-family HTH domain
MRNTGKLVRASRKKLGLTQMEISVQLGTSFPQFLCSIEAGKAKIPSNKIKDYAKALKIKPSQLIEAMTLDYVEELKRASK